jgi:hypothetical protein
MEVKVEVEHDRFGVGYLPCIGYELLAFPPCFDADVLLGRDSSGTRAVGTWTMLIVSGNIQTHAE